MLNFVGMKWTNDLPEKDGRYVVKTKSTVLGTENVMYATIKTGSSGTRNWSFSNQTFLCYLQE